jgi:hypothetical protein
MPTYNLSLPADLHLRLVLPYPVFDDPHARLLLGAYLPGTNFVFDPPEEPTLTIAFKQSREQRVARGGHRITLHDHWRGQASLLDFIHLTYGACRLYWLQHELYSVHSACVDDLLIVGHSGAGKTSTALRLASKGRKIFSGNKTLLKIDENDQLVAIGGTHTITAKAADASKHLSAGAAKVAYVGRTAFMLDDSAYSEAPEVNVRRIAITQVNDGADSFSPLEPLSALHRLFPFFLDAVNADAVVCGGNAVLPGTPPRGSQKALAERLLPALQKHVTVCAVTGSMPFIENALEVKNE